MTFLFKICIRWWRHTAANQSANLQLKYAGITCLQLTSFPTLSVTPSLIISKNCKWQCCKGITGVHFPLLHIFLLHNILKILATNTCQLPTMYIVNIPVEYCIYPLHQFNLTGPCVEAYGIFTSPAIYTFAKFKNLSLRKSEVYGLFKGNLLIRRSPLLKRLFVLLNYVLNCKKRKLWKLNVFFSKFILQGLYF